MITQANTAGAQPNRTACAPEKRNFPSTSGVCTALGTADEGGSDTIKVDGSAHRTRFRRLASTGVDLNFEDMDDFKPLQPEQSLP